MSMKRHEQYYPDYDVAEGDAVSSEGCMEQAVDALVVRVAHTVVVVHSDEGCRTGHDKQKHR